MRFALLLALSVLGCAVAKEPKTTNDHAALVKELERDGYIVIDSSLTKPTELPYEAIGRVIICMRADDVEDMSIHRVSSNLFRRGHFSILVRCGRGILLVSEGYL